MMAALDLRLHAYRPDLADINLKGKIEAQAFAKGKPYLVTAPVASLRQSPRPVAPIDTELVFGERLSVFEVTNGWAWCQASSDGYVGYTPINTIHALPTESAKIAHATHVVRSQRATCHPEATVKAPPMLILSFGSHITILNSKNGYAELASGGFIHETAIRPVDEPETDPVAVALRFLHVPYLWGGRSGFGIDCSGLVQLAWQACGISLPRDTDLQSASFGEAIAHDTTFRDLKRGDLIFWKGHVGIWIDDERFLHANAADMATAIQPLSQVCNRIKERGYGDITRIKRPPLRA